MRPILAAAAAAIGIACATCAEAATIKGLMFRRDRGRGLLHTEPFSYGYVTLGGSTAGMWGYQSEWIAARSEFDMTGVDRVSLVVLSFTYGGSYAIPGRYDLGGSFSEHAFTYLGDNQAQKHDFTPPERRDLATIDGIGGSLAAGPSSPST